MIEQKKIDRLKEELGKLNLFEHVGVEFFSPELNPDTFFLFFNRETDNGASRVSIEYKKRNDKYNYAELIIYAGYENFDFYLRELNKLKDDVTELVDKIINEGEK